jgi:hypothetical protein
VLSPGVFSMNYHFRSDWHRRAAVKATVVMPIITLAIAVLTTGCGTAGAQHAIARPQANGSSRASVQVSAQPGVAQAVPVSAAQIARLPMAYHGRDNASSAAGSGSGHIWRRPWHRCPGRLARPVGVRPRGQPRLRPGPRRRTAGAVPGSPGKPRPDHWLNGAYGDPTLPPA